MILLSLQLYPCGLFDSIVRPDVQLFRSVESEVEDAVEVEDGRKFGPVEDVCSGVALFVKGRGEGRLIDNLSLLFEPLICWGRLNGGITTPWLVYSNFPLVAHKRPHFVFLQYA